MSYLLIILILAMGLLARSKLLVLATVILLIIRLINLKRVFQFLAENGLNLGLLILIMTVLLPFVSDQVTIRDLKNALFSLPGLLAIVAGLLATKLNGMGLNLLEIEPHLIISMIIGSIIGIVFWGGVPVGPLMAGGLAALFVKLWTLISKGG